MSLRLKYPAGRGIFLLDTLIRMLRGSNFVQNNRIINKLCVCCKYRTVYQNMLTNVPIWLVNANGYFGFEIRIIHENKIAYTSRHFNTSKASKGTLSER